MDDDESSFSSVESQSSGSYDEETVTDDDVREVVLVPRARHRQPHVEPKNSGETVSV